MSTQAITRGAHHIGLTVPNLDATNNFFKNTLGYEQIGEIPDYPSVFLTDGVTMITLWQAEDPTTATPFDRKNVIGLHHFALGVENHAALDSLYAQLQSTHDINIEFAPEPLGTGTVRHMMTNIPGGIRVEFISASA
ncbi:MAG: VOC family protein [Gammaproteobacteria bacterium]|nr:VOC family protein [Gammaproteobacteria bacterium]